MKKEILTEILTKAIERAIDNGYAPENWHKHIKGKYQVLVCEFGMIKLYMRFGNNSGDEMVNYYDSYRVIFSHEFAKAFWEKGWQHHLANMVLEEDPILYLSKFIH